MNAVQQFLLSVRFEVLMHAIRKTVISCPIVRWVGAGLWEGPAVSSITVEDSYTLSETLPPV